MRERKKRSINIKKFFAAILAVSLIMSNASISSLAYEEQAGTQKNYDEKELTKETPVSNTDNMTDKAPAGDEVLENNHDKTVIGIQAFPATVEYEAGVDTEIDYKGLKVQINYSDGTSEQVYDGETTTESGQEVQYDSSSIDWSNSDLQNNFVIISCGDSSTSYHVILNKTAISVTGLEITTYPGVQEYLVGSTPWDFNYTMRVKVTYSDGSFQEIHPYDELLTGDYLTCTENVDFNIPGDYPVTISYPASNLRVSTNIKILKEEDYIKRFEKLSLGENLGVQLPTSEKQLIFTPTETGNYCININYGNYVNSSLDFKTLRGELITNREVRNESFIKVNVTLEEGHSYILEHQSLYSDCVADIMCERLSDIKEIKLLTPPVISQYPVGYSNEVDYSGMRIKVIFENGKYERLTPNSILEDGREIVCSNNIDFSKAGNYQITASCGDVYASTSIRVLEESEYIKDFGVLEMGKNPTLLTSKGLTKFIFTASERGLYRLQFNYDEPVTSNVQIKTLTENYVTSGSCLESNQLSVSSELEEGHSYIVTIDNSISCSTNIICEKLNKVTDIQLIASPAMTKYPIGYTGQINYYGIVLKIIYDNGTSEILSDSMCLSDGRWLNFDSDIDFSVKDTYIYTVSFENISVSGEIEVLDRDECIKSYEELPLGENTTYSLTKGRQFFCFTAPETDTYYLYFDYKKSAISKVEIFTLFGEYVGWGGCDNSPYIQVDVALEKGQSYLIQIDNEEFYTADILCQKNDGLTELYFLDPPYNLKYPVGYKGEVDYDQFKMQVNYENGTSEIINANQRLSNGGQLTWYNDIDFTRAGSYYISVSYAGFHTDYIYVKVLEKDEYIKSFPLVQLEKPAILDASGDDVIYTTTPKTTGTYLFNIKDAIGTDPPGLLEITTILGESVSAHASNDKTGYTEASLKAGVSYALHFKSSEATSIYFNSWKASDISEMKLLSHPLQLQYPLLLNQSNLNIDFTGLKVQVTYKDGKTETLGAYDTSRDGRQLAYTYSEDKNVPGEHPVTVSLGDSKILFYIQVLPVDEYLNTLGILELNKEKELIFKEEGQSYILKYTPDESGEYVLNSSNESGTTDSSATVTAVDGTEIPCYPNSSAISDVVLKAGKTYFFKLTSHEKGIIKYCLTKPESAETIEIASMPANTMFFTKPKLLTESLSGGLELKAVYTDGRIETLVKDQTDTEGRSWSLDVSQIQWSEVGSYPVIVNFGELNITFDIQVVDGNEYFKTSDHLLMPVMKGNIDAYSAQNYYFVPQEDGYYSFTMNTTASGGFPYVVFYDDNYQELDIKTNFSAASGTPIAKYTIQLQAGQKYYLNVNNENSGTDTLFQLTTRKEKIVKELKFIRYPTNTVRIAGAEFKEFYPSGEIVEAIYEDGSTAILNSGDYSVDINYNPFQPSNTWPSVTYLNKSISFSLDVVAPQDYEETVPLILNKFAKIENDARKDLPAYLYFFQPRESKAYYINLYGTDMTEDTSYCRLLSGTGEIIDIHSFAENTTWKVSLNKNQNYYIAVSADESSYAQDAGISITDQQVTLSSSTELCYYTGDKIEPSVKVTINGKGLTKNKDYKISYFNNINAGPAYAEVTAVGDQNFATARYFFTIKPLDIEKTKVSDIHKQAYTGEEMKPNVIVQYNSRELKEGSDYELHYESNVNIGTARVIIKGCGNFEGVMVRNFAIEKGNTLKYELNGGLNNKDNPDMYNFGDVTLKSAVKKRYLFDGWYTDKNFKNKITIIKGGTNKNYTLYAKWTKITVGKVSGLEASASGTTTATAKWTALKGANGYQVDYAANSSFTSSKTSTNTDKTSVSISKLPSGATRYIRVRAYVLDSAGEKVYGSYNTSVTFKLKPAAPKITKLAGGAGKITITWEDVSGESGYQVYMATSQNGTYSKIASPLVNATSYTATSLKSASTYYFKVRAYNKSGTATQYSSFSVVSYAPTSPSAPAISKITGGTKAVTLNWKDVSGENGYQIYMSTSQNGTYSKVATAKANATSYTVKDLSAAKTYYFKIRSYRTVNSVTAYSSFSSIKSAATRTATPVINSVTGGSGKATVKWKAVTGASGYVVYMATSSGGTYKNIGSVKSSTTSLTKTGLSNAKNYYFKVRAYRSAGGANVYSSYSSYKWCGTATAATSITKITAGTKKVSLQWKNVSGESGYQVYMATSKNGTYRKVASPKTNATSYTKSGLTKGKTYYFKVRTYRKVNGQTVYSSFSAMKYIKTK